MKSFAWEIKLDPKLTDRESKEWGMDRSLGRQKNSVPEDGTEARVRCCCGRWVDLSAGLGLGLKVRK